MVLTILSKPSIGYNLNYNYRCPCHCPRYCPRYYPYRYPYHYFSLYFPPSYTACINPAATYYRPPYYGLVGY